MKKAQITMFVVLGIFIVGMILFVFFYSGEVNEVIKKKKFVSAQKALEDQKQVKEEVEACLKLTTKNVLRKVFLQGGYYVLRDLVSIEGYDVPLYLDNGKENVPDKQEVAQEVAYGIKTEILDCVEQTVENVKVGKDIDVDVELGTSVDVQLYLPLTIEGDTSSRLVKFNAKIKTNLLRVYEDAVGLYQEVKGLTDQGPLSEIAIIASEKDYDVIYDVVDDTQVYFLYFDDVLIDDEPLMYSFAIRNVTKGELTV